MTQRRFLFFFLIVALIGTGTYFLVKLTKGYRFNLSQRGFQSNGLLVATSNPDGAQVFVNNKLRSATNTTVFLAPDTYEVEIKKEGFLPWKKTLKIEKELVTKTDAWLFPLVPNLQALTFTGVGNPLLSPEGTKIVYQIWGNAEKNGLWVLNFSDLPFGISHEPRQIALSTPVYDFSKAIYRWSPDSRQILVTFPAVTDPNKKKTAKIIKSEENFLFDANTPTPKSQLNDLARNLPLTSIIKSQWEKEEQLKQEQRFAKLPEKLSEILRGNTQEIFFSPDETKILYAATSSATLPDNLLPQLPGSSTQTQERSLQPGHVYVYDLKEDRNFAIKDKNNCQLGSTLDLEKLGGDAPVCTLCWFPSSRHLILVEKDKIQIVEYESTNWLTVYSGPYQFPFAYASPGGNKLLILAKLSNLPDSSPNLYAVSLR